MAKVLSAIGLMLVLLSGCTMDPCTFDKASPSCAVSQSQAQATISAIDSDRELRSTQSAIYLSGEGTKSAVSSQATKQAVRAAATQAAMQADATRNAIGAQSTQDAVVYASTQTFVNGEATKQAVQVSGVIDRANAERAAVPYNAVFNVVVFWFLIPALVVGAFLIYGQRALKRVTESATQALHKRAAMVTYGPPNNPQLAFVTFDPHTGQPIKFITSEGLIGNHADLLSGATMIDQLDVPEPMKLAALVEAAKRSQAARIAAATNSAPWSVTTVEERQAPLMSAEPIGQVAAPLAMPRIPTFAELLLTWRPSVDQMLFGFGEDGQPVYGRLDQLLSALVIGRQGQGKTTLLRLIDRQCALIGVRVLAWDIHDDISEDIPSMETYTSAQEIERSANDLITELDRRIRLKLKHDKAQPIMVLIDEVNLIADKVPSITEFVKRIVAEGRKYMMFEFITAKGAPSDLFEKSWARDSFSALIAFWTSSLQARNVGFDAVEARRVETLTPGHALLRLQTAPAQVVTFPDLSLQDMRSMSPSKAASKSPSRATSEPLPEVYVPASREGEKGEEVDPFEGVEAAGLQNNVRRLIKKGKSNSEIIAELWGVTGGNAYKEASKELSAIIGGLIP
jgi:hypothetical protein